MANLTTHQLAEILLGVARAQHAIVDALENSKAGFKSTHLRPMLETASRIRSNRAETLSDFPPRLLLHMLGRNAPAADMVSRELEELLSREPEAAAPAAKKAPAGGDSLDMT